MDGQLVIPEYTAAEGFSAVVGAADTVTLFVGKAFAAIVGNPFLCVSVAAGLLALGVRVWLSLRRASR